MDKIIHYCWFGPKLLPKLAKKCTDSWEKIYPDYEIKLWNVENVNLEESAFIKEAYENKKWAFVDKYVRTKVLYGQDGIYMDTNMEPTKSLEPLMTENFIIGFEDSGYIAAGLIVVKNMKNKCIKKILDFYQSKSFNETENLFERIIPKVLTNIFKDDVDLSDTSKIIKINKKLPIYLTDYFYQLSYDRKNNIFTENTYGIHYYDASWISFTSKISLWLTRHNLGYLKKFCIPFIIFSIKKLKKENRVILCI